MKYDLGGKIMHRRYHNSVNKDPPGKRRCSTAEIIAETERQIQRLDILEELYANDTTKLKEIREKRFAVYERLECFRSWFGDKRSEIETAEKSFYKE